MSDERWLEATWPFIREHLPAVPARVLEVGCGPHGGFVPRMRGLGYNAIGVDPDAPAGTEYRRVEFERGEVSEPVDALVASQSLHHVADLNVALDRMTSLLNDGAVVIVVEWAHERFDEATARWCFDRLPARHSWLDHHREDWMESGLPWHRYFQSWVEREQFHAGHDIMQGLQARFDTQTLCDAPYFFADLEGVTQDDEQAAIDAGLIRANELRYVGHTASHVAG